MAGNRYTPPTGGVSTVGTLTDDRIRALALDIQSQIDALRERVTTIEDLGIQSQIDDLQDQIDVINATIAPSPDAHRDAWRTVDGATVWEQRAPVRFSAESDTVFLYQQATIASSTHLVDSSANGYDLTLYAGTSLNTSLHPTFGGIQYDGATGYRKGTASANAQISNDYTIEFSMTLGQRLTSGEIVCHMTVGETEATNQLWGLRFDGTGAIELFSESGAGVNSETTSNWIPPIGIPFYFAVTYDDEAVIFYAQGTSVSTGTHGARSTGGGDGFIHVGCNSVAGPVAGGFLTNAGMSAIRFSNTVHSAAVIKETYNDFWGPVLGRRP